MKIIFATGNQNKVEEVQDILQGFQWEINSLKDIGFYEDIEETGSTMKENAMIKAKHIYVRFHENVFSEDTGLEVSALDMAPGVKTARYAGEHKNNEDNMKLLLENLSDKKDRTAQFKTVAALILDGKEYYFEGILKGSIHTEKRGNQGFGYDPIFIPDGYQQTLAELGKSIKSHISHRAKAIGLLADFLKDYKK